MKGISSHQAGDPVGPYRRHGRRHTTYSVAIGGGLVANVVDGTLTGFGLEPVTELLVGDRHVTPAQDGRRRLAPVWVAPLAGAAAAAGVVATGVVLRHRRAA